MTRRSPHTASGPLTPVMSRAGGRKRTTRHKERQSAIKNLRLSDFGGDFVAQLKLFVRRHDRARHERVARRQGFITSSVSNRLNARQIFGQNKFPYPWQRYGSRE